MWNTFDFYVERLCIAAREHHRTSGFESLLKPSTFCLELPIKVILSPTDLFILLQHQWICLADILQGKSLGESVCSSGFIMVSSSRIWKWKFYPILVSLKLWKLNFRLVSVLFTSPNLRLNLCTRLVPFATKSDLTFLCFKPSQLCPLLGAEQELPNI